MVPAKTERCSVLQYHHTSRRCFIISRKHLFTKNICPPWTVYSRSNYVPCSVCFGWARALGRSSVLLISRKLSNLSGTPPYSINSFRLASLLALVVELNLYFFDRRACVIYQKNKKTFLLSPSRGSAKICSWPCTFLSLYQRSSFILFSEIPPS